MVKRQYDTPPYSISVILRKLSGVVGLHDKSPRSNSNTGVTRAVSSHMLFSLPIVSSRKMYQLLAEWRCVRLISAHDV